MKKVIRYCLALIGMVVLAASIYFIVVYPPLMAANASKLMCSCVYVMKRSPESVVQKEFKVYPSYLQPLLEKVKIEFPDSNGVTAKIMWATKKSIYRKGLGCTLLAERVEEEVRKQNPRIAEPPLINQDSLSWPMGNVNASVSVPGVDYEKINQAINEAFEETDSEKPKNTHAVLILYDGKIVGEKYGEGFNHNSLFMGWSMTKSITNGIAGVLVKKGKLKLDAPAPVKVWEN
ncbi:MAG TPA: serine hydrolase, partial [Cyclobacteriaceae bacterium]|nr:serine hydrolase [Cyclobacteriaceae bacterium]